MPAFVLWALRHAAPVCAVLLLTHTVAADAPALAPRPYYDQVGKSLARRLQSEHLLGLPPVSYTHLTLPTNREV